MDGPLASVPDTLARILAGVGTAPALRLRLEAALGRVTTTAITCPVELPRFDNSAMDGFAVRASDTARATTERPVVLAVVGTVSAGSVSPAPLSPGTAARIATGAPVPTGADAVVRREAARELEDAIHLHDAIAAGRDIRRRGEDVRVGDVLLAAGTRMSPAGVAALAAAGVDEVEVHAPPRVAIVTTGDEVVASGTTPGANRIPDAVGPAAQAWCRALGAQATIEGPVPDRLDALTSTLHDLAERVDVLVTVGGVSVGHRDHLRSVVDDVELWGVALQPGKPFAFGRIDQTPWFGLPGNPVAALATLSLFVEPALRRLQGHEPADVADRAPLVDDVTPHPTKWRVLPARWADDRGTRRIAPLPAHGSAAVRHLGQADAFIVLTPGDRPLPRGTQVAVRTLPAGFHGTPG